jgi:hypothetical protein
MNMVVLAVLTFAAPVDFDTDVLPVLTRAGCNAGACHGAAAGRGGFKLSLFGGDPAADYRAIVSDLEGRRVNLARPERSLLLLKPTWELDHEGGQRFETDSPQAIMLRQWIESGAQRLAKRQLSRLAVEPAEATVATLPTSVPLTITAHFSDESARHVEDTAVFTAADPASTGIVADGSIRVLRPGRHTIIVRYLTEVRAIQITAPFPNAPVTAPPTGSRNWIDDEIDAALSALHLPTAPRANDATLLRRLTLDLTGRLPSPERVREYLSDKRNSQRKYEAELDRLLASDECTEFWTYKLAEWLGISARRSGDAEGRAAYVAWLREQVAMARPLDEWAAELITAEGDSHALGPPNFHRTAGDARTQAEHVAESLLAIRLRCANCHNHPLDRWTQDDYHGLAAIFAGLDRGQVVKWQAGGEVLHPATGEAAVPRIPGEKFLDPQSDGRPALAAWLASQDNPHFARAWANRLWAAMFGRGLVDPIDDLRDTNPATHPALLARLSRDFAENKFNLRHTLRLIATSATYQRSGLAETANRHDDRFYSHARPRPLSRRVLLAAACQVMGVQQETAESLDEKVAAFDPFAAVQCSGAEALADARPQSLDHLGGQLEWLNGEVLNAKLADPASQLRELAASRIAPPDLIEEYFLRTLSRLPTADESQFWQQELTRGDRAKKCEDFAWSLLSCRDFVTNH